LSGSSTGLTPTESTTLSNPSYTGVCRYYLDWHGRYTCVLKDVQLTLASITGTHLEGYENFNVTRVYFVQSELVVVPGILFDTFENLNFLSIQNCGLSVINDKTFNKCGNLANLDASNNEIIHVNDHSLRNCTNLKTIDLTGNPVDYIDSKLFGLGSGFNRVHLHRLEDLELA
jgi:Leucine-rich repeat (LRR) protein